MKKVAYAPARGTTCHEKNKFFNSPQSVLPVACKRVMSHFEKMSVRSRAWCFTINNPTEEDLKEVTDLSGDCRYIVVGNEIGEEGTPHYQGFVYMTSQRTLKSMKKRLTRAHLEKMRGTVEQNIDYCTKDKDVLIQFGDPPTKNSKIQERMEKNKRLRDGDLNELVDTGELSINQVPMIKRARVILEQEKLAKEIYETEECKGVWIYGPPGVGKTHFVREKYGPDLYVKSQSKWWDGYSGHKYVILDDFDFAGLGHNLKIWLDKWPCSGEVKGGTVCLRYEKMFVTSNYSIEEMFPEENMRKAIRRRCKVLHFDEVWNERE